MTYRPAILTFVLTALFILTIDFANGQSGNLEGIYKGYYYQHNLKTDTSGNLKLKLDSTVELDVVKAKVSAISENEFTLKIKGTILTKTINCLIQMRTESEFDVPAFLWKNKKLVGEGNFDNEKLTAKFVIEGTDEVVASYEGAKKSVPSSSR